MANFNRSTSYHEALRKHFVAFGSCFSDIRFNRYGEDGSVLQTINVPILYGNRQKFLTRIEQDPDLDRKTSISLPRISYEMVSMNYDGTRKINRNQRNYIASPTNPESYRSQYVPAPWNFQFDLDVYVKLTGDGIQIMEQIVPFFQPEWHVNINFIPDLNLKYDVPITLLSVFQRDDFEGEFDSKRVQIWTYNFLMKGYLFGPLERSGQIKRVIFNLGDNVVDIGGDQVANTTIMSINTIPGLTDEGEPTANSAASIPHDQIMANSNYGIIQTIDKFGI